MKPFFNHRFGLISAVCVLLTIHAAGCGCGCGKSSVPEVVIDLGGSSLYTAEERQEAVLLIKEKFASFSGDCELHSIRYAGDEANNGENLKWLNSLREARSDIPPEDAGKEYTQVAEFLSDFHSPVEEGPYAWELDMEYRDYQWWLARSKDGGWEIVSWGY